MIMNRVCVDQDTVVTHDWRYSFSNPSREGLPKLPRLEHWNFPAAIEANSDALAGHYPATGLYLRPPSAREPTPALQSPVFSNCTLPVVIVCDFPYNMGEFLAKTLTAVDELGLDERVTLALQTPEGLALAPYHSLLLLPYSRYPAISVAELGTRWGGEGGGVPWSPEPSRPHCFNKFVLCKYTLRNGGGSPLAAVGARVVAALAAQKLLPPSPVAFPPSQSGPQGSEGGAAEPGGFDADPRDGVTLRVLIESRRGPVRNIKNLEALIKACEDLDGSGFSAGRFSRLSCAGYCFTDPATADVSRDRFLANVAAVRSAHVLVTVHGAGASNSWFMRQGSSALVELRPCRFGTHYASWPDKYMPNLHARNEDAIRFFALNVEDKEQCLPGDVEASYRNHSRAKDTVKSAGDTFARDRHLVLAPRPFTAFLAHVGALLRPGEGAGGGGGGDGGGGDDDAGLAAYRSARDQGRLHGYLLPGGVLQLGDLGRKDLDSGREQPPPPPPGAQP